MAKSCLSFKRNTTDKLSIKGTLSDDCSTITYTDENGDEKIGRASCRERV